MERRLEEICVEKVLVMRQAYLSEAGEHCKRCCDGYNFDCDFYMSIKKAKVPVRNGRYACQLQRS